MIIDAHKCGEAECCYLGQPSPNSCRCHKTYVQMLEAEVAALSASAPKGESVGYRETHIETGAVYFSEERMCDNEFNRQRWRVEDLTASTPPAAGWNEPRRGIYIASKTKHAERWKALRESGLPIISTWINEAGEGESADLHDLWRRCLTEASECQVLIAYREKDEVFKGGWVEIGAALAENVPVYAVGLEEFTIAKYRGITHFPDMKSAIAAARAALSTPPAAGESNGSAEARLREAVDFYADERNWIDTPSWDGDPSCNTPKAIPMRSNEDGGRTCDCGDTAREFIREIYGEALSPAIGDEAKKSEGSAFGCKRAGAFVDRNCMAPCDCHITQRLSHPSDPPDRREIVARVLFARLFRQPLDPRVQVWENYNSALHRPYYDAADAILSALDGGAGAQA